MLKIRETKFDDTPVSIYQENDEYILEFMKDGDTIKHSCGTNTMFWEAMSEIFGSGEVPDAFVMVDLINKVEDSIDSEIKSEELMALVYKTVDEQNQLMPAYIPEEMLEALKQRLHYNNGVYRKLLGMRLEDFLTHAINTKMIFRMSNNTYNNQYVRINKLLRSDGALSLYVALIEIEEDEDGNPYWCEDSYTIVKYNDVQLVHHKMDELPADYVQ